MQKKCPKCGYDMAWVPGDNGAGYWVCPHCGHLVKK